MTKAVLLGLLVSVAAGLIIELFFQLVKYRDSLNKEVPRPVTAYGNLANANNYMSVSEYLSGGNRKWVNYFLFRAVPPLVVFILLSGALSKYLGVSNYSLYILLAAVASLAFRDLQQVIKANLISEKLLHIANSVLVLVLAVVVALLAQLVDFAIIAPSVTGLIDNLWSSLLIAMLVLIYIRATDMNSRYRDESAEDTAIDNYIFNSYLTIKNKHSEVIEKACHKQSCSPQILYAVLIHENMNRPAWMRAIENKIVQVFGLKLSIGIAQVQSSKSLTDEESIKQAAKILAGSNYADSGYDDGFDNIEQLQDVLKLYNDDEEYADAISQIISRLREYAAELFEGDKK